MREAGRARRGSRARCRCPSRARAAIRVEDQAQFHPREYLVGLADRIAAAGGRLFEGTRALKIREGKPCEVETARGDGRAAATSSSRRTRRSSSRFALHTKIAAVPHLRRRRARAASLPPPGLYYDSEEPYHYVRTQDTTKGTFLVVGGEDHKVGQDNDTRAAGSPRSSAGCRSASHGAEIVYRWSGPGHRAGRRPAVHRPRAGREARVGRDRVLRHRHDLRDARRDRSSPTGSPGRENPFAKLYDATRVKPLAQARRYVAENVDFPKQLAKDRARPRRGRARSPRCRAARDASCGVGGKMIAAYRADGRPAPCRLGGVHAPRVPRAVERRRAELGLPVPRQPVRHRGPRAERPRGPRAPAGADPGRGPARGVSRPAPATGAVRRRGPRAHRDGRWTWAD